MTPIFRIPNLIVPAVCICTGILIIFLAWNSYSRQVQKDLPDMGSVHSEDTDISMQELQSMFHQPGKEFQDQLQVIAEKNLFSSSRKAWAPSNSKNSESEPTSAEDKNAKSRARDIPHAKIRLYGTTMTATNKTALIHFTPFADKDKYRLVHENQVVRDVGKRGEWLYYTVMDISSKAVILEGPLGERIRLGLYERQRRKVQSKLQKKSRIKVSVGGESTNQASAGRQAKTDSGSSNHSLAESESSAQDAEQNLQGATQEGGAPRGSKEQDEKEGENTGRSSTKDLSGKEMKRTMQDLRAKDKARLIQEGVLEKIETSFGTVYRPATD